MLLELKTNVVSWFLFPALLTVLPGHLTCCRSALRPT